MKLLLKNPSEILIFDLYIFILLYGLVGEALASRKMGD